MKQLLQGDALEVLRTLPSESVQCCITSPPYWGLRDYGIVGQYGLESTPELYISKMVEVFREVKRVLRSDGTLWLNMGDGFYSGNKGNSGEITTAGCKQGTNHGSLAMRRGTQLSPLRRGYANATLKPKDLVGMPWALAFALRADGWYLRQDIIWAKPNPMPESVTDRCTKSHEYIFLLSKSERYYYDAEAIKEESVYAGTVHSFGNKDAGARLVGKLTGNMAPGVKYEVLPTRNKRSVWEIATAPYPEAHFATFPPDLVKPCILAGTSEKGCCSECGAPWERITETTGGNWQERKDAGHPTRYGLEHPKGVPVNSMGTVDVKTIGWQPTCKCYECTTCSSDCACNNLTRTTTKRCVVLDPFAGSGTVGLVAQLNHCDFIGIELNKDYCELARRRIESAAPLFNQPTSVEPSSVPRSVQMELGDHPDD